MIGSVNSVGISLDFDSNGNVVVQQVSRSLEGLARSFSQIDSRAVGANRALRDFESQVNRASNVLRNQLSSSFEVSTRIAGAFGRTLTTLVVTGLGAVAVGVTSATAAIYKLSDSFITVNEQFKGLEITLKSTFKSLAAARDLVKEVKQLTATSPIPLNQLADVTRSLSVIPFSRAAINTQIATGGLNDPNGFFLKANKLVERMIAFRPDKSAEDAIFAIREALSGEFRSLIRRFDIPSSALSNASGKPFGQLKQDPAQTFAAMDKFFSDIISNQAIREYLRQPRILKQQVSEQLFTIPLSAVGDSGLFEHVTDFFYNLFEKAQKFVDTSLTPLAKKISESMTRLFDVVVKSMGRGLDALLSQFGFGAGDRPDLNNFERVYSAIEKGISVAATKLPEIFNTVLTFLRNVLPAVQSLLKVIAGVAEPLSKFIANNPITGLFGLSFARELPSLLTHTVIPALSSRLTTAVAASFTTGMTTAITSARTRLAEVLALPGLIEVTGTRARLGVDPSSLTATQAAMLGITARTKKGGFISNANAASATAAAASAEAEITAAGVAGGRAAALRTFGGAVLRFAGAVGLFIAAAQLISYVMGKFASSNDANGAAALAARSGFNPEQAEAIAQQYSQDYNTIIAARKAQNVLTGVPVNFPGLDAEKDRVTNLSSSVIKLRDFLKGGPDFTDPVSGQEYSRGLMHGDVSTVAKLFVDRVDALIKAGSQEALDNFRSLGLVGVEDSLTPAFTRILTATQEDRLNALRKRADSYTDVSSMEADFFPNSASRISILRNALQSKVEGSDATEFEENLRRSFDPSYKNSSQIISLTQALASNQGLANTLLSNKGSYLQAFEPETRAAYAKVSTLLTEMQSLASEVGESFYTIFDQKLITQLQKLRDRLKDDLDNGGASSLVNAAEEFGRQLIESNRSIKSAIALSIAESSSQAIPMLRAATTPAQVQRITAGLRNQIGALNARPDGVIDVNSDSPDRYLNQIARNPFRTGEAGVLEDIRQSKAAANYYRSLAKASGSDSAAIRSLATQQEEDADAKLLALRGPGAFQSLGQGVKNVADVWRETAANMQAIGENLATALKSSLADAFTDIAMKTKTAGEAFQQFGQLMLRTAINLFAQQAIQGILGFAFGGVSNLFTSTATPAVTSTSGILSGISHAAGGPIRGGSGMRDDVPALLMGGEYVIPKPVVRAYGEDYFDSLLASAPVRMASGGYVATPRSTGRSSSSSPFSVGDISIQINNDGSSKASVTAGAPSNREQAEEFARQIKGAVIQIMAEQHRNGGIAKSR